MEQETPVHVGPGHNARARRIKLPTEQIYVVFPTTVCEDHLADPDTVYVFDNNLEVFGRRNPP